MSLLYSLPNGNNKAEKHFMNGSPYSIWTLRALWGASLAFIPLLSLNGRAWQRSAGEWLDAGTAITLISLALAGLLGAGAVWLIRRAGWRALWHLLWSFPLFILLPLDMPVMVERIHFLVFGLFGFLSVLVFGPLWGFAFPILFAGLDELFQWWLPDRVGDLRDVSINILAGAGGALLALMGTRR